MASVWVYAYQAGKSSIFYTRTDRYGAYSFKNLPAGTYTVQAILPPGYMLTTAKSAIATLPGSLPFVANFGLARSAAICGYCFFDRDRNLRWNKDEPGEYGVPVFLSGPDLTRGTLTDSNGYYCFTGLSPGTYTVEAGNADFPCTTADRVIVTARSGQTVNVYRTYSLFGVSEHEL